MTTTEIVLPGPVEPDELQVRARDLPPPGQGQVVLRMEATGVSFAEQQMRLGKYYDQPPFPFVPGYDVVGTVVTTGPGVDSALTGRRFAAVVKTGGWASHLHVDAADLVAVPVGVEPAAAETVLVNGVTAWQMLHRCARVATGGAVVVLGANGGVGTTLVQLARHAGLRVIGTAAPRHHDAVRALGAEPLDYRDPGLYQKLRGLAPEGVDAVFDHVGGEGLKQSWRLLRRGGALVNYGSASAKGENALLPTLALFGRLYAWNYLPNGRSATFYNFWAGRRRDVDAFRARLAGDMTQVLRLIADGTLEPQIAARIPLRRTAEALRLAESRTVLGKVVIVGGTT
ncbi:medium chain dehydrogenase/reductase family protein [Actinophytocola oryzae]|uniref:NADPH2:quinone reductase n=1 Tax=Actinophytocola oryzae TaxID=502181 RepID=A0A4R7W2D0_9PSEU|nr:medium chain dehydrogenase/reductase family protein [Actinophytocola oryzae]TDV56168.1 NADPH2:quinone reductase [Actinophytocola oryzae]